MHLAPLAISSVILFTLVNGTVSMNIMNMNQNQTIDLHPGDVFEFVNVTVTKVNDDGSHTPVCRFTSNMTILKDVIYTLSESFGNDPIPLNSKVSLELNKITVIDQDGDLIVRTTTRMTLERGTYVITNNRAHVDTVVVI